MTEHKKGLFEHNGAQSVRLEKRKIDFKNYFKQIPVPFKIYAEFEYNLKSVESYEGSYSKRYQDQFLVVLLTSLFVLLINLVNRLLFLEVKMLLMSLLKQFLKSLNTVKK